MKTKHQLLSLTPDKARIREIMLEEFRAFGPSPSSSDPSFLAAIELRKDIETREALLGLFCGQDYPVSGVQRTVNEFFPNAKIVEGGIIWFWE